MLDIQTIFRSKIKMTKKKQLIYAASTGNLQDVKCFIKQGVDIHAYNDSALISAALYGHLQIVKFLIENGANISANNYQSLKWAKQRKHYKVVRYLEAIRTTQQYKRIYY